MSCKKCEQSKTVILRQKDFYCDLCFMTNTNHKFRARLGKNKVLPPNENVLICISGGVSSTVLLDLIQYGISLDNTKKLRIVPIFFHIFDDERHTAHFVLKQCKKYAFNVYLAHISDYMNLNIHLPEKNVIPDIHPDVAKQFQNMLDSMTPTAACDYVLKIKRMLFVKYAKLLQCKFAFTAETSKTLASKLLTNLAVGRGAQVQHDIGFSDTRDEEVNILRPVRDISEEELDYYVKIKQLQPLPSNRLDIDSLQTVIDSFVCNLQSNFPSTISTVCKTADKIGSREDRMPGKCVICESNFNDGTLQQLSALEATSISRTMSFENNHNIEVSNIIGNENHTAVFPFVHKYLCYGCSRNHSEMNQASLPQHLFANLK